MPAPATQRFPWLWYYLLVAALIQVGLLCRVCQRQLRGAAGLVVFVQLAHDGVQDPPVALDHLDQQRLAALHLVLL